LRPYILSDIINFILEQRIPGRGIKDKILITDGTGFIGSHLIEELVKKAYNVVMIDDLSNGRIENLAEVKGKVKVIKSDIFNPI